jgi:hypothetical protein
LISKDVFVMFENSPSPYVRRCMSVLRAPKHLRGLWLKKMMFEDADQADFMQFYYLLFFYCHREYLRSPSKTKAICIYEDIILKITNKPPSAVKSSYDKCRELIEVAKSKSWYTRILTSGQRKSDPSMFESFSQYLVKDMSTVMQVSIAMSSIFVQSWDRANPDMPLNRVLSSDQQAVWDTTACLLEAGTFDLSEVGLR